MSMSISTIPYWQKLKDPRWQKRRLEIMKKHEFSCSFCADPSEELHIHHWDYRKGAEPWEYDDSELACLCHSCHQDYHKGRTAFNKTMLRDPIRCLLMFSVQESMDSNHPDLVEFCESMLECINLFKNIKTDERKKESLRKTRVRRIHNLMKKATSIFDKEVDLK